MSKVAWVGSLALVGLALGGIACNASSEEDVAGAESKVEDGTKTTASVEGLSYKVENSSLDAPKDSLDEFFPEMKTCDTNMSYFQLSGGDHAQEINKLLRGEGAGACESPMTYDSDQRVWAYDKTQGLLSVVTFANFYFAGAAHPNSGIFAENYDLKGGKKITLDELVDDGAMAIIQTTLREKLSKMKNMVSVESSRPGRLKTMKEPLEEDIRDSLLSAVDAITGEGNGKASDLTDFVIAANGIRFDLSNQLPHALGGLPVTVTAPKVTFTKLEGHLKEGDLLNRIRKMKQSSKEKTEANDTAEAPTTTTTQP